MHGKPIHGFFASLRMTDVNLTATGIMLEKQIPFGDDSKKSKSKGRSGLALAPEAHDAVGEQHQRHCRQGKDEALAAEVGFAACPQNWRQRYP